MFVKSVKTPGVAHLSYILGSQNQACVIDPRRDIDAYLSIAKEQGCNIELIIETHRNEDIISGAPILADITGAKVMHGPNADETIQYAETCKEGDSFDIGNLRLEILETPGHTKDSISILLYDTDFDQGPVGAFTGDTLFIGDVGRADFYPDEAEAMAESLYNSLQKLADKAPAALVYPAHGAGSVCGDGMAEREFSSIAHELANNGMLKLDKDDFIHEKVKEEHDKPPYFSTMEALNAKGAGAARAFETLKQLTPAGLEDSLVIDVRGTEAFRGSHIPGALCLPGGLISAYAGWILKDGQRYAVMADSAEQAKSAYQELSRIGFDNCDGYCTTGLPMFAAQGNDFGSVPSVDTDAVKNHIDNDENWTLLDVRKPGEYDSAHIDGSSHIYLGQLPDKLDALDEKQHYTVMCASGARATVAASLLKANGTEQVDVYLGSMGAWNNSK